MDGEVFSRAAGRSIGDATRRWWCSGRARAHFDAQAAAEPGEEEEEPRRAFPLCCSRSAPSEQEDQVRR